MIHLFMSWMIFLLVFIALSRCMLIWCSSLRICFNMLNLLAWHNCRRIKADYSIYHIPIETLESTGDMLMISSSIDSVKNYLTNFNTAWLQVVNIHCSFCCLFCAVWRASLDGPRTLRIQLVLSANIHLSFSIFTVLLMAGLNLLQSCITLCMWSLRVHLGQRFNWFFFFKEFVLLRIIFFACFLNCFDVLMLKINFCFLKKLY